MSTIQSMNTDLYDVLRNTGDRHSLFDVINALPAAIYTTDASGNLELYNRAAARLWGMEPDIGSQRYCGSWRLFHPDGTPMPHDQCPMAQALKSGVAIEGAEALAERPDGTRVPFLAYPTPLRNGAGDVIGAVNMLVDITKRKADEQQLGARVRQLRAVSELGILALAGDELQQLFDRACELIALGLDVEFVKLLELKPKENCLLLRSGIGWDDGLVGKARLDTALGSQAGYTLSVNEPVIVSDLSSEKRFKGPSLLLDHGVVSGLSVVVRGTNGTAFGVIGAHTSAHRHFTSHDVDFMQSVANIVATAVEDKLYRDRQSMLVRELTHRVKNNLAVIQSIARQSGHNAEDMDGFMQNFEGRLSALARAHDLLTDEDWAGTSILNLVELVVGGRLLPESLEVDMEDIKLNSEGTQGFTLVLHELMTNAVKYGAASKPKGRIFIEGRTVVEGERKIYQLAWREKGGPKISKPGRFGFGSKLVKATIEGQFSGKLLVEWQTTGLVVRLHIPISAIS